MIAKSFRLNESQIRKVLSQKKPFFSYMFIANIRKNKEMHGRMGVLLSGKHAPGSVNRNALRRNIYDLSLKYLDNFPYDIVFVPKKGTILQYKDRKKVEELEKNIIFLWKTLLQNVPKP